MNALVAMGGVDTEGHQGGTHVVTRLDGGRAIRAIVAKHIALMGDLELLAELDDPVGEMVVEGSGLVRHRNRDAKLA